MREKGTLRYVLRPKEKRNVKKEENTDRRLK